MKKLALVLGSLLVVGTAASAKEVMPAPAPMPERVVEVVEKPVIVYRDKIVEVEAPAKWRPNGSVNVETRYWGEVEGHKLSDNDKKIVDEKVPTWNAKEKKWEDKKTEDDSDWNGDHYRMEVRTTAKVNFTEKQSLEIHARHNFGLTRQNNETSERDRFDLTHSYNFGNLGSSKVMSHLDTKFRLAGGTKKFLQIKPVFDFSEYFFKNDYVKATALELAPVYRYTWTRNDDTADKFALYANAEFELPYGVTFQAEFDNLFSYDKENATERTKAFKDYAKEDYDRTSKTGNVELTLAKAFDLYKTDRQSLNFELKGVYATSWAYSKGGAENYEASVYNAGTYRENGKAERWGAYTAKFEPSLNYNFKATEFVNLYARVAGEYVNRNDARHSAKHWRWQPTARLGFKASF